MLEDKGNPESAHRSLSTPDWPGFDDPKMASAEAERVWRFLGPPTRGGTLVVLNGLLWMLAWTMGIGPHGPDSGNLLALVASVPIVLLTILALATGVLTPGPSASTIGVWSVLYGLNSLLWGYGLSWLWSVVFEWKDRRAERRRRQGLCIICGYNLTGNVSGICPECGTPIHPLKPANLPPQTPNPEP